MCSCSFIVSLGGGEFRILLCYRVELPTPGFLLLSELTYITRISLTTFLFLLQKK